MYPKLLKYSKSTLMEKISNDIKINLLTYLNPIDKINFIKCNKELYTYLQYYKSKFI